MPNYNPYMNNMYLQDLQSMKDRIDRTMQQYQHQQQQPTMQPITQNFQLAPQQFNTELEAKYATNVDEVKNTFVIKTGLFATKDFSTIWVKDVTGNIRTYKTEEVVELDEKDKQIQELKKQINELKGVIENASTDYVDAVVDGKITANKSTRVSKSSKSDAE